jgi:hypothetical protein
MALLFPQNPSVGDTYQSGSSSTYQWTGTYWRIRGIRIPEPSGSVSGIVGNPQNINYNISIPENYNALLIGDVTVDDGFIITVGNNSVLKVLDI